MKTNALRQLAVSAALGLAALPADAGGGAVSPDQVIAAEILSGWQTDSGSRMAALHLTLAPGWKTYWRAPGDAGIPPTFSWDGSKNLKSVRYHWPRPEVFESFGTRTVGYHDELVLPIELIPNDPTAPIALQGEMDLGVCETICMPAKLRFSADLQGTGRPDAAIKSALAAGPVPGARAGVREVRCEVGPTADGVQLTATIRMPALKGGEVALVEAGDPRIWVSDPTARRKGENLTVQADLVPARGTPLALDRSALRFTVIGSKGAVDILGCTPG
ncbi:protein-disulfide reductase DsbD domain-containing protein [Tropicimonas sp. IMCC34043]|uniref:protein-disulfide reductase DsbD domain-containing protein n=1 Tax=Tropicimonas sp. IMCC34043 TaxID=2248760 RepID=UPI000E2557DA|nr:protein-disulfide reductase DsbD domain-containing protein [Tropicimonas sp. IMCC34043]